MCEGVATLPGLDCNVRAEVLCSCDRSANHNLIRGTLTTPEHVNGRNVVVVLGAALQLAKLPRSERRSLGRRLSSNIVIDLRQTVQRQAQGSDSEALRDANRPSAEASHRLAIYLMCGTDPEQEHALRTKLAAVQNDFVLRTSLHVAGAQRPTEGPLQRFIQPPQRPLCVHGPFADPDRQQRRGMR